MSGRAKRILYAFITIFGYLAALAAAIFAWYFTTPRNWIVLVVFGVFYALLPLNVLIHELGHIAFGAVCGMKFVSVKIGRICFFRRDNKLKCRFSVLGNTAGECALFPKSEKGVRGRFLAATLGGALFNFAYAIVFVLLYFFVPHHPALLFFEMFAPLSLLEGIAALIPVELTAGKTDGLVVWGLAKRRPEEEVALRVLEAQGTLFRHDFSAIPPSVLFDTPVVREDLPAWHALLLLRVQYLLWEGREDEARDILARADENEEIADEDREQFARYMRYFEGKFAGEHSPMYGVTLLEKRLAGEV